MPYNRLMTATKSRRLEARLDPVADDLIIQAARLMGESRSTFMVRAARESAERVIARADVTIMPAEQFDILIESLDAPDPVEKLARAAAGRRAYQRA